MQMEDRQERNAKIGQEDWDKSYKDMAEFQETGTPTYSSGMKQEKKMPEET